MSMCSTQNTDVILNALLPVVISQLNERLKTMTSKDFCRQYHVSPSTISRLRNCGGLNISLDTVIGIYLKLGGELAVIGSLNGETVNTNFRRK